MIGYLRGVVKGIKVDTVFIEVSGIGYRVQMPLSQLEDLPGAGEECLVHTHLINRDDSLSLYGFTDERGLEIFRMLLEVSGVGPRLALNILSVVPVDDLIQGISAGDTSRLQAVHGVGRKTAARICVDLKEKARKYIRESGLESLGDHAPAVDHGPVSGIGADAVSALSNLGYRPSEAKRAVMKVLEGGEGGDLNSVIKASLQILSRIGRR